MKKTVAFLVVALFALVMAFGMGATDDGVYAGVTNKAYRPLSSNYYDGLNYGLFRNPSDLAVSRLRIQGLGLSNASYNFAQAVQNRSVAEAIANITKFHWGDTKNWIGYILGLTLEAGGGYNDIIGVSVGSGAQINNFAFGLNIDITEKSMPFITKDEEGKEIIDPSKRSVLGNGYLPLTDYALSFAYGRRIIEQDSLTLDVGAAIHFAGKVYMKQVNFDTIRDVLYNNTGFKDLPARGGFAIPVDLGATFSFPLSHIKVSATVNNLNGYYYTRNYSSLDNAALYRNGTDPYTIYTPWTISSMVQYSPEFKNFNPTVTFEFIDMNKYFMDELDRSAKEIFRYMSLGVKLDIFKIVSIRAAYKYGYPELGVCVEFKGNSFEMSYGFQERGEEYGFRPVDCLSVRFKLGFEK